MTHAEQAGEGNGKNSLWQLLVRQRVAAAALSVLVLGGGLGYYVRWDQERPDKTCTYDIPDVAWESRSGSLTITQGNRDASVTLFRKDDPERNDATTYHSDSRSAQGDRVLDVGPGTTHIRLTDSNLSDSISTIVSLSYHTKLNGGLVPYGTTIECGKEVEPPENLG